MESSTCIYPTIEVCINRFPNIAFFQVSPAAAQTRMTASQVLHEFRLLVQLIDKGYELADAGTISPAKKLLAEYIQFLTNATKEVLQNSPHTVPIPFWDAIIDSTKASTFFNGNPGFLSEAYPDLVCISQYAFRILLVSHNS
jgi:hypothetical protein